MSHLMGINKTLTQESANCVVLYYYGVLFVYTFFFFSFFMNTHVRMYGKSLTINLTKCAEMLFSHLYKWIKQQQKGKKYICKRKAEWKRVNLQLIQWQNIRIEIVCCVLHGQTSKKSIVNRRLLKWFPKKVRVSGWLLTRWQAGWLTGRSWCYIADVITH